MRQFISIENYDFSIKHYFPDLCEFEMTAVPKSPVTVLTNFEQTFVFTFMSTQGGTIYWNVTYSQIDGPIENKSGEGRLAIDVEIAVNQAMAEFTKGWRSDLSLPQKQ